MTRLRRIGLAIKSEDFARRMTPATAGIGEKDDEQREVEPAVTAVEDSEAAARQREGEVEQDAAT